jgi:hypothetical protein
MKKLPTSKTNPAIASTSVEIFDPLFLRLRDLTTQRKLRRNKRLLLTEIKRIDAALSYVNLESLEYLLPDFGDPIFKFCLAAGIDAVLRSAVSEEDPAIVNLIDEAEWNSLHGHYIPKLAPDPSRKYRQLAVNISAENWSLIEPGYEFPMVEEQRDLLSIIVHYSGHQRVMITVPLKYVLKQFTPSIRGYHTYSHRIVLNKCQHGMQPTEDYVYFGVTKRSWIVRLKEHISGIRTEAKRKIFYQKFSRGVHLTENCFFINFELVEPGYTYEQAMNWEEWAVENAQPVSSIRLNMIPGGFKGQKNVHKLRSARPDSDLP